MKKFLVFCLVVAYVFAEPAKPKDDVETVKPVLSPAHHFREPEFIYGDPFDFFGSFADILKQMQSRFSDAIAASRGLQDGKEGNTTSVTKIINGHKYVINETEYSGGDENLGSVFKVRVVDIRPLDDNITTTPKDVEKIEKSEENEIPRVEQQYQRLETLGEEFENLDLSNDIIINELDGGPQQEKDVEIIQVGHSLADDIKINEIAAMNNWTPDPNAEILDIESFDPVNEVRNSKYKYTAVNYR